MATVITVIHVLVCLFLILVVLLQAGKGGGMGIAFGGAGSNTVFGGSGAGNFLTRLTVAAAFSFMITSMTLAYLASNTGVDPLKKLSIDSRAAKEAKEQEKARILEAGEHEGDSSTPSPDAPGSSTTSDTAVPADTDAEGGEAVAPQGAAPAAAEGAGAEAAAPAGDEPAEPNDNASGDAPAAQPEGDSASDTAGEAAQE